VLAGALMLLSLEWGVFDVGAAVLTPVFRLQDRSENDRLELRRSTYG
jgi:hypothetical protein